jgi:hypothetical protein
VALTLKAEELLEMTLKAVVGEVGAEELKEVPERVDKVARHLRQKSSVLQILPEVPLRMPRPVIDDPEIN